MAVPEFTLNEQVSQQLKDIYNLLLSYKDLQAQLAGVQSQLEAIDPQLLNQIMVSMAAIGMLIIEE